MKSFCLKGCLPTIPSWSRNIYGLLTRIWSGEIPVSIGDMKPMEFLDLSYNDLRGKYSWWVVYIEEFNHSLSLKEQTLWGDSSGGWISELGG